MPRPPRLHVPGGHYHVVLRGNHREALFASRDDRAALDGIVSDAITRCGARVYAYCWMSNHLHALVQIAEQPLGGLMQRIAMPYSRYRHRLLGTCGHLFERRYYARLVDFDNYFTTLLRYIHLNPVRARLVAAADDYPWSSHAAYLGQKDVPWVSVGFGLEFFGSTVPRARRAYARFMRADGEADILALEAASQRAESRLIGSTEFVEQFQAPNIIPVPDGSLIRLAADVCTRHQLAPEQLCSASRARALTPARRELVQQAIRARLATRRELAAFLNRDPSYVTRLLADP